MTKKIVEQKFDHKSVEIRWQNLWRESKLYEADLTAAKKPFYNLMMFPYPSAEGLHVGNMYAFTGADIYGRFKAMQGNDVFEPIGLDGFGIHSENYAMKIGRHPLEHAEITQRNYYIQLHRIGAMYDWSKTVETYDPDYYRWTQWLFVQMFKNGLAYRAKAEVNWCPSCRTVLADEQVIDAKCERCGNTVEKRALDQWFFRITAYADKLLKNTFSLNWTEKVLVAQRNWIGRNAGLNIDFQTESLRKPITVWTKYWETIFGTTFIVLSPKHWAVRQLNIPESYRKDIERYISSLSEESSTSREVSKDKTGVFTGCFATNPANGANIPIWIADYVLADVGTGAVMGVPAHDERDFVFVKKYHLPIRQVVSYADQTIDQRVRAGKQAYEGEGKLVNSAQFDGLDAWGDGKQKMAAWMKEKGYAREKITYHLRDWLISRQRYWGPPIPMIFCQSCFDKGRSWFTSKTALVGNENFDRSSVSLVNESQTTPSPRSHSQSEARQDFVTSPPGSLSWDASGWYPEPEDQLPVILPNISDYKPANDGVAPLAKHKEFYETKCPGCGGKAVRETDVSDTFLDSSWYFLRYPSLSAVEVAHANFDPPPVSSRNKDTASIISNSLESGSGQNLTSSPPQQVKMLPWDPAITKRWLPVDMYTGGAEHSVLHLLYSRFVTMALKDWGYIDFEEPFEKFFAHGLVIKDGAKMSKSKGNVVNPDEYIDRYGADALRLYLMFMGPFSQGGDFRDSAMEGMSRWVGRIWRMASVSLSKLDQFDQSDKLIKLKIKQSLHRLIAKITDDLEKRRYNTAIASMMEWTNLVADEGGVVAIEDLEQFILLLAPFAPHLAEELWQKACPSKFGQWQTSDSVQRHSWPVIEVVSSQDEQVTVVVQVDNRVRDAILLSEVQAKDQKMVEAAVSKSQKAQKFLAGAKVKRVIFVPGKLVNFVTG